MGHGARQSRLVEIARHVLGDDWLPGYVNAANRGGIERVLV